MKIESYIKFRDTVAREGVADDGFRIEVSRSINHNDVLVAVSDSSDDTATLCFDSGKDAAAFLREAADKIDAIDVAIQNHKAAITGTLQDVVNATSVKQPAKRPALV